MVWGGGFEECVRMRGSRMFQGERFEKKPEQGHVMCTLPGEQVVVDGDNRPQFVEFWEIERSSKPPGWISHGRSHVLGEGRYG